MTDTRFRAPASLPNLPEGSERVIIEAFRGIQQTLDTLQVVQRNSRPVVQAAAYQARAGELVLIEGRTGGTLVTIPQGSSANVEQKIRIALIGGVLSPGVTIAIVQRMGTINGNATLTLTTRGIVELTSVGDRGWVAVFTSAGGGGGGLPPDGAYGDITVSGGGTVWTVNSGAITIGELANIADETFVGNVSGAPAAPSAIALSSLAGTNLTWNSALNRLDASGGGSVSMTDATITVAYGAHSATANVVDAAILAGSRVGIFWGTVLASDVNEPEMDDVTFTCTPAAGSMTVWVSSDKAPVGGPYKIRYLIG